MEWGRLEAGRVHGDDDAWGLGNPHWLEQVPQHRVSPLVTSNAGEAERSCVVPPQSARPVSLCESREPRDAGRIEPPRLQMRNEKVVLRQMVAASAPGYPRDRLGRGQPQALSRGRLPAGPGVLRASCARDPARLGQARGKGRVRAARAPPWTPGPCPPRRCGRGAGRRSPRGSIGAWSSTGYRSGSLRKRPTDDCGTR